MSNEIISISSSDGDDSTIVSIDDTTVIQLLSPLPVKSEPADDHSVTSSTVRSVAAQHTPSGGTANILYTSCRSITYRLASLKPLGNLSTVVIPRKRTLEGCVMQILP